MFHRIEKLYWTGFTAWQGRNERQFPFAPASKQQRIQNRRVRSIVAFAFARVPFYRDFMNREGLRPADFRSAADLGKLPVLSSRDLSENPERFRPEGGIIGGGLDMETSGSTGIIKQIRHDTRALFMARAGGQRSRFVLSHFTGKSLGYRETRVARRGGTGPSVLAFYRDHSWVPKGLKLQRAMVHPEESFEENIRVINEQEPDVVGGFGSYIGAIYRWAWLKDIPIFKPRVICYGGDTLQQPDRKIIEQAYGIPVISRYQACEALNIAFQCEKSRGFHISTDQVAVRIADRDGKTLPPGETGEVVMSNLINRGTVLLNYRIGDLARMSTASCSCGRTLPMLESLQGRSDDLVVLPGGQLVHESVLLSRLYSVEGTVQIQVVQNSLAQFVIRVVCSNSRQQDAVCAELTSCFLDILGTRQDIDLLVEPVEFIPQQENGKFRSVISLVNVNG